MNMLDAFKKANSIRNMLIAICIFCNLLVLNSINYSHGFILIPLIPILYFFYKNAVFCKIPPKSTMYMVLPAFLISLFTIIGEGVERYGRAIFLFNGTKQFIHTFMLFIGCFSFLYGAINLLFNKIESIDGSGKKLVFKNNKILNFIFYKRPFLCGFVIIFISWLPYLVASYPVRIMGDTIYQLGQIFGTSPMTQHHPVLHTFFLGCCLNLGRKLHSDNLGLFIYSIIQYVVLAFSFAISFGYIVKKQVPNFFKLLTILFFSFFPIFPLMATLITKDVFFCAFVLLYTIFCLEIMNKPENIFNSSLMIGLLFIITLLCCLSRHNGVYVVVFSFLAIVLYYRKNANFRTKLLAIFLPSVAIYFMISDIILPSIDIPKGSIREMLTIPFQQTARYIKYHGDDVTEEERKAISNILDYDTLPSIYDENCSDPVKDTSKDLTKQNLFKYFNVYFKMFLKHPLTCIDATINGTFGYWYCSSPNNNYIYPFYTTLCSNIKDEHFNFHNYQFNVNLSKKLDTCIDKIKHIPVVSLLFTCGFYTHTLIVVSFAILFIKKNRKVLITFIPAYTLVLICIASPVNGNGYSRYMWPIMSIIPLIVGTCFFGRNNSDIE